MKRWWNRFKIHWAAIELDRKGELGLILGGMVIAGCVLVNNWRQLEQMSVQTTAMQGQLKEMKEGSNDTKTIAESAKTQAESMKHMAETMRRDQRAWVGPYETSNLRVVAGTPVRLEIDYKNGGKTPAMKFSAITNMRYQPADSTFVPEYNDHMPYVASAILFPGMSTVSEMSKLNLILDQSRIEQLRNGSSMLYFFGKYSYRTLDIDGGGTFCMYLGRDLSSIDFCETYNDAY